MRIIPVVFCLAWPGITLADCTLKPVLERIVAAHQRIAGLNGASTLQQDSDLIASAVGQLSPSNIASGLQGIAPDTAATALQTYVAALQAPKDAIRQGQYRTAQSLLFALTTNGSLQQALQALNRINCPVPHDQPGAKPSTTTTTGPSAPKASPDNQDRISITIEASYVALAGTILVLIALAAGRMWLRKAAALRKRRGKRFMTNLAINIRMDRIAGPARILDISCRGAKLRCGERFDPLPGKRIGLEFGAAWHAAHISWSNHHYCGVQFDKALTFAQVKSLLTAPDPPAPPLPGKSTPQMQNGAPIRDAASQ